MAARALISRLADEHAAIASLLDRIASTGNDEQGVAMRRNLFPVLARALRQHARLERRQLYGVLVLHRDTRELAIAGADDHMGVEQLLRRLSVMDMQPPSWREVFDEMRARVADHIAMEEREIFPRLERRAATSQERAPLPR